MFAIHTTMYSLQNCQKILKKCFSLQLKWIWSWTHHHIEFAIEIPRLQIFNFATSTIFKAKFACLFHTCRTQIPNHLVNTGYYFSKLNFPFGNHHFKLCHGNTVHSHVITPIVDVIHRKLGNSQLYNLLWLSKWQYYM